MSRLSEEPAPPRRTTGKPGAAEPVGRVGAGPDGFTVARPDDGVVEPGMLVTYQFKGDSDADAETFLLGAREIEPEGITVYSPQSPLGQAINGRSKGETVSYEVNGKPQTVTILDAKPYEG